MTADTFRKITLPPLPAAVHQRIQEIAMTDTNLDLWNRLKPVDRRFTKPITGKSYKGDSPNPTWMVMKATEQLGPIGDRWGFRVVGETIQLGKPHAIVVEKRVEYGMARPDGTLPVVTRVERSEIIREQYHQVHIRMWFKQEDGTERSYDAFGGTPMLYLSKKGEWQMDEDAAKKSLTDAYTKGLSWLGVAADIFLGLFDDKYSPLPDGDQPASTGQSRAAEAPPPDQAKPAGTAPPTGTRQTTQPTDDGW